MKASLPPASLPTYPSLDSEMDGLGAASACAGTAGTDRGGNIAGVE